MRRGLTQSAGARAVVVDPYAFLLPEEYGVDLQPKTRTSIALQNVNITRAEAPYTTNCTKDWSHTGFDIIQEYGIDYKYTLLVGWNYKTTIQIECFYSSLYFRSICSIKFKAQSTILYTYFKNLCTVPNLF